MHSTCLTLTLQTKTTAIRCASLTRSFCHFQQVSRYVSYRDPSIAIRIVSWGYRIITTLVVCPNHRITQNVNNNGLPVLSNILATHQNCVNNHDELDTVCRHYNAMFGVHDIESRCEVLYSKCVAVFTATAMYIRPILFTLNMQ